MFYLGCALAYLPVLRQLAPICVCLRRRSCAFIVCHRQRASVLEGSCARARKIWKLGFHPWDLSSKELQMFSDSSIEINNQTGKFKLEGKNSKLINGDLYISGDVINGFFENNSKNTKEVIQLYVEDQD